MVLLRRWSLTSVALVLLAVAAGLGSFALVRGYAAELESVSSAEGEQVSVVVAGTDLPRGTELSAPVLRVERFPQAFAPPGAFGRIDALTGRTIVTDLAEGEAVTRTRVGASGGPIASAVPSGLRAFVVTSGLPAGVLESGDRVDVIATFGGPRPYTDTVGTSLEVLSIVEEDAGAFEAGGTRGPAIVLLVSQVTAEQLAQATAFGRITVTVAPPDG